MSKLGRDKDVKPLRKKKQEEWEEVETSLRLEFWKEHSILKGSYHQAFAIKGWRKSMEDCMDIKSSIAPDLPNLFGVFDGHGGDACAKFCQSMLLQKLAKRTDLNSSPKLALADEFLSIDEDYNKKQDEESAQAGSTATVLYIQPVDVKEIKHQADKIASNTLQKYKVDIDNRKSRKIMEATSAMLHKSLMRTASITANNKETFKFYCAIVGDSRALMVYQNGKVVPLSNDHNLLREDELERIESGGGEIRHDTQFDEMLVYSESAQRGLNVTRSIGDRDFKPLVTSFPEIKEGFIPNDAAYFIIASDGLWGKVSNDEVGRIMMDYGLVTGLRSLANLANKRECFDNITIVAIDIPKMLTQISDHRALLQFVDEETVEDEMKFSRKNYGDDDIDDDDS